MRRLSMDVWLGNKDIGREDVEGREREGDEENVVSCGHVAVACGKSPRSAG